MSANLGMSYSIANVLVEAGISQIKRWLPFEFTDTELADRLRNKMIRPTSIPQTIEELWIEQAVCREALRLSLAHHRSLAIGLEGRRERGISDIFRQSSERYELVDLMKLDIVIGSGGVLSHAPSRMQAALMMIDGFGLEGVTQLAVDSIFMMPHLGVFASVHPEAAYEVFENDCLVQLGCAVVPVFPSKLKRIERLAEIFLDGILLGSINCNEVTRFLTPSSGEGSLKVVPLHRSIDIGAGAGQIHERRVIFGECGVIVDGRNRPLRPEALGVGAQERVLKNLGLKG